jgi:transcription initiation factor IIE alpha subunit
MKRPDDMTENGFLVFKATAEGHLLNESIAQATGLSLDEIQVELLRLRNAGYIEVIDLTAALKSEQ